MNPEKTKAKNVIDFERTADMAAKNLAPPVLSEDAIALEFVNNNQDLIRFDHTRKAWFTWLDNRWQANDLPVVAGWMRTFVRTMGTTVEGRERKQLGSRRFVDGVDGLARIDSRIAVTFTHWDQNVDALGAPDGIVDLRTGELIDPDPEAFITRATAVNPDTVVDCRRWHQFLNEVTGNDAQLKRFLQQWAGYCLTAETKEQKLVFIHGPGGTGKSVFANTLRKIMGDYATAAAMETFTDSKFDQHPEALARLDGMRLVLASETEAGHRWRENRIKTMTGEDTITAHYMRQDSFTYQPKFKLTMVGNHAPAITNLDSAIRRRFLIVPFDRVPAEKDDRLEETLREEWPGILRWMINGAVDWYAHGKLVLPPAIDEATSRYFDNQDLLGQWLAECCDADPENQTLMERSVALFASWSDFAKQHGETAGTQATFNDQLQFRGFRHEQIKVLGTKGYRGIRLKLQRGWNE
jgi:putative DNA primase/helicase